MITEPRHDIDAVHVRVAAKVNLYLRVLARRPDGYHEVETVLQSIALHDELTFVQARKLRISCNRPEVPLDRRNLVWKAAEALRRRFGLQEPPYGAAITLRKEIPVGAGLGGGSADAAAALYGLARLWRLDHRPGWRELAADLGSDVPFFLMGGTALARGRGEQLEPVPSPPTFWLVLVKPPFPISTPWAYQAWHPGVESGPPLALFQEALAAGAPAAIAAALRNDLQPGVERATPAIRSLVDRLCDLGALGAQMTGSGSAVFGIAAHEEDARRIADGVEHELGERFVVPTLAR